MGHEPFRKPIYLRYRGIGNFKAGNAWEAFEYLDRHWPLARTPPHYRRAKVMCREALDGTAPSELARLAVLDAAQRAGLLAPGWRFAHKRPGRTSDVPEDAATAA